MPEPQLNNIDRAIAAEEYAKLIDTGAHTPLEIILMRQAFISGWNACHEAYRTQAS